MGLDPVTYLRTEWVSAALCTNQMPRSADVCLQLGVEDGRLANFVPRTLREIITSSAEPGGEGLTTASKRSMKQAADRRGACSITYSDQPADDLRDTKDASVDVVVSLQAMDRLRENGLDWKLSVREAARVLKPGGRLLFVEAAEVDGESYLDYLKSLINVPDEGDESEDDAELSPVFDDIGFDGVDMVLVPHIAGVAVKALDADLSSSEKVAKQAQESEDDMAEKSINAFERGNKRRRRKKKKVMPENGPQGM